MGPARPASAGLTAPAAARRLPRNPRLDGREGRTMRTDPLVLVLVLVVGFTSSGWAQVRAGGEFRVNTQTAGSQFGETVAFGAAGDFIVLWHSPDGNRLGVFAQRYDAIGAPQGSEF